MKKLVLSILLAAVLGFGNAQEIRFGAKGGLNVSTLAGGGDTSVRAKVGYHVGAMAEIRLIGDFAIQPELLLSAQGNKYTYQNTEVKLRLTYLNMPIMGKYFLPVEGLAVEFGPQIGIKLGAKNVWSNGSNNASKSFSGFDFGLNFGANYTLLDQYYFGM